MFAKTVYFVMRFETSTTIVILLSYDLISAFCERLQIDILQIIILTYPGNTKLKQACWEKPEPINR